MTSLRRMDCCGVQELVGVNQRGPEGILRDFYEQRFGGFYRGAYVIFTGSSTCVGAKKLAAYIEENGLGEVVTLPKRVNPNSGNRIKPYLWSVDLDAMRKLGKAKKW
jgi:hypothetical protein